MGGYGEVDMGKEVGMGGGGMGETKAKKPGNQGEENMKIREKREEKKPRK